MEDLAAETCAKLVSAPGPLKLPLAWQPATAHDDVMIGNTSAENVLAVVQSGTKPPGLVVPPPLDLEQETKTITEATTNSENFFIDSFLF